MAVFVNLGAGILIGVLANLGFGPITILAITRRLRHGVRAGMEVGVVASCLDGIICLLATQAAGFVTSLLAKYSGVMKVAGSVILGFVAAGLIRHARTLDEAEWRGRPEKGPPSAVVATVLLFVSSPVIPGFWLGMAGLGLTYGFLDRGLVSALFFSAGATLGGLLRYVILMKVLLRSVEKIRLHLVRRAIFALSVFLVGIAAYGLLDVFVFVPTR